MTSTTLAESRTDRAGRVASAPSRRMAAADTLTVSSGMISFGLVLGITVRSTGRDELSGILGAAAVYGGSAQLTTATLLSQGPRCSG
jgi:predicted branched-subunit amino acid permease